MTTRKRSNSLSEVTRRTERERKFTEKGAEYNLMFLIKELRTTWKEADKLKVELNDLFVRLNEPGVPSVVSAILSDLTRLRNEISGYLERLTELMDIEAPYLVEMQSKFKDLEKLISSYTLKLQNQNPSSVPKSRSNARSVSGFTTASSRKTISSIKLEAKLALALEKDKLKEEESQMNERMVQLERQLAEEKNKQASLRKKAVCTSVLEESLNEAACSDDVEAVLDKLKEDHHHDIGTDIKQKYSRSIPALVPATPLVKYDKPNSDFLKPLSTKKSRKQPNQYEMVPVLPANPEEAYDILNERCNMQMSAQRIDPILIMTKIQVLNSLVPLQYGGDSLKFPIFRETVRSYLEDGILGENDKRAFLSKFLKGEVLEVFQANVGLSYVEAIDLLERRYGNPIRITEAWTKNLMDGPTLKINNPKGIVKFSESLHTACRVLSKTALQEVSSKVCLKKIVSRLPPNFISKWISEINGLEGQETIQHLADFVERITRSLTHPVYSPNIDSLYPSCSGPKVGNSVKGLRNQINLEKEIENKVSPTPSKSIPPSTKSPPHRKESKDNNSAVSTKDSLDAKDKSCKFCSDSHFNRQM